MKRFAVNRLYLDLQTQINRCILEVDNEGNYQRHYPLIEEIAHTIWKGGVALLAHEKPVLQGVNSKIKELLQQGHSHTTEKLKCWHLTGIDFEHDQTTATTQITLLK